MGKVKFVFANAVSIWLTIVCNLDDDFMKLASVFIFTKL